MGNVRVNIFIMAAFSSVALSLIESPALAQETPAKSQRTGLEALGEGPILTHPGRNIIMEQACSSREPWATGIDTSWNSLELGVIFNIPERRAEKPSLYTRYNCPRPQAQP